MYPNHSPTSAFPHKLPNVVADVQRLPSNLLNNITTSRFGAPYLFIASACNKLMSKTTLNSGAAHVTNLSRAYSAVGTLTIFISTSLKVRGRTTEKGERRAHRHNAIHLTLLQATPMPLHTIELVHNDAKLYLGFAESAMTLNQSIWLFRSQRR